MVAIEKRKGTIANVLTEHQAELFNLIETQGVKGCRERVLELLNDESITDKKAVVKAKSILSKAKPNLFISTLATYMTGMKVS